MVESRRLFGRTVNRSRAAGSRQSPLLREGPPACCANVDVNLSDGGTQTLAGCMWKFSELQSLQRRDCEHPCHVREHVFVIQDSCTNALCGGCLMGLWVRHAFLTAIYSLSFGDEPSQLSCLVCTRCTSKNTRVEPPRHLLDTKTRNSANYLTQLPVTVPFLSRNVWYFVFNVNVKM